MTNGTALKITAAARVLADVVDEGVAAGLPEPYGIVTRNYSGHSVSFMDFDAVEAWATHLGILTEQTIGNAGTTEFLRAYAEVDRVRFEVTANRSVA